jgi:hypothetical protein
MMCKEFYSLIELYMTCDLPPAQVHAFHQHAAGCTDCCIYLHSYQKVVGLLKEERRTI